MEQSELPGPSVQGKALDEVVTGPQTESNDNVNVEKEAPTDGKDLEESSSRAPATQTRRRRIQKRYRNTIVNNILSFCVNIFKL